MRRQNRMGKCKHLSGDDGLDEEAEGGKLRQATVLDLFHL